MMITYFVDIYAQCKYQVKVYWCVTLYNCLIGNIYKDTTKYDNQTIDYQSEMLETKKYKLRRKGPGISTQQNIYNMYESEYIYCKPTRHSNNEGRNNHYCS